MDAIIIGIYGKHYQYFTKKKITAKEKSTKRVTLMPVILAKIWCMIGCSNTPLPSLTNDKLLQALPMTNDRLSKFSPNDQWPPF